MNRPRHVPSNAIPNPHGGLTFGPTTLTFGPTTPIRKLIRPGTSLVAQRAIAASIWIRAGSPMTPTDLCDGPVRVA